MKRALPLLCALLLAACATLPAPAPRAPVSMTVRSVPIVSGRLRLPAPPARRLLSEPSDLLASAIVSLIDADGNTRVTGLVAPDGTFTLTRSTDGFEPVAGALYTIEAINRIAGDEGGNWGALRTVGKRLANGTWESLSGAGPVELSLQTTILARIMDGDPAATFDALEGKAAGGALAPFSTANGTYDAVFFADEEAKVSAAYAEGSDPAGERVYHGDVTITKQSDFAQWRDYDAIGGVLQIDGSSSPPGDEITAIALPRLKRVTGLGLVVNNCPGVTSLAGLGNLRSCIYMVLVNVGITSLAELDKLKLPSNLGLGDCANLSDLSRLAGATYQVFQLQNLPQVTSLPPISAKSVLLWGMPQVTSLAGVRVLEDPQASLSVQEMDGLQSLAGLAIAPTINSLYVRKNAALTSLAGLEGLTGFAGGYQYLIIQENPVLADASALSNVTAMNGMTINLNDNPALCLNASELWPAIPPANYYLYQTGDACAASPGP